MTEDLIKKFIANTCTDEEHEIVLSYLKEHPDKIAEFMTEEEWITFESTTGAAPHDKMWSEIYKTVEFQESKPKKNSVAFYWAAASILAILFGAVFYFLSNNSKKTDTVSLASTTTISKDSLFINSSDSIQRIILPDNSLAEVYEKSSLRFARAFEKNKRDIYLEGKGKFHVTKDKSRPFTVYAGNTATTALGTVFTVTQTIKTGLVKVHLYEGKVVIKKYQKGNIGEVLAYLTPGNEYINDSLKNEGIISAKQAAIHPVTKRKEWDDATYARLSSFTFKNQPLFEILETLKQETGANIKYNKQMLLNITYTGTLNPGQETLEQFLNTIGMLNNLSVMQTSKGHFVITKAN